jgi:hypothetical protein
MGIGALQAGRVLVLSGLLAGVCKGGAIDWSMMLSPQSAVATSNQTLDLQITFVNNSTQDIFFSDFGDGQGISVDLEGNVVGNGVCGIGVDCFVQNLFLTSADPIDIPAGSTGATFDLGLLELGAHNLGDQITVVAKGGPDSLNGIFPNPAFFETTAVVTIAPEPAPMALFLSTLLAGSLIGIACRLLPLDSARRLMSEIVKDGGDFGDS